MSARPRGKWSDPEIPRKGWECIDFEDLDEPSDTCEMCEFQTSLCGTNRLLTRAARHAADTEPGPERTP
jgi:hypothetical protein